jgi:hypothetical protein
MEWKQAMICPVYKKGDSALAANYRPIALTCVARKLFERSIFLKYIGQEERKLAKSQADFRPGRNTTNGDDPT